MTVHHLHRVVDLRHPEPLRVEIHAADCDCPACEAMRQSDGAPPPALTLVQIGNLVWLGLAIGSAIAFAIDPHGAWLALTTVFGSSR